MYEGITKVEVKEVLYTLIEEEKTHIDYFKKAP